MANILKLYPPDISDMEALDREYMELFVVPNPRYVAPYESVFRDRWLVPPALMPGDSPKTTSVMIKGLVMGESTLQVQQCYLDAGVLLTDDLPDHISNELRFMAYLWEATTNESLDDQGRLKEMRSRFRSEHLMKWLTELKERISESDQLGFYATAIQIVELVHQQES